MEEDGSKIKTVAIQGIKGSFHEIAARGFFESDEIQIVPCETFTSVVEATQNWQADYGVMAIENTVAGSILPNYSLLRNSKLKVVGEVYLRIEQNLLGIKGTKIEDLREVYSHPMAISQSRVFFKKYPFIKLIESPDTALSAKNVSDKQDKTIGAISSKLSADIFDLEILAPGIETHKKNYTRFLIMIHKDHRELLPKNPNKASLCFSVPHVKGALYRVLAIIAYYDNNLTKIQSIPIIGRDWQYLFYADLTFESFEMYRQSLEAIKPLTEDLEILGEYETGKKSYETVQSQTAVFNRMPEPESFE